MISHQPPRLEHVADAFAPTTAASPLHVMYGVWHDVPPLMRRARHVPPAPLMMGADPAPAPGKGIPQQQQRRTQDHRERGRRFRGEQSLA